MSVNNLQTSWSLFEEPYWLDIVAPNSWDAVTVIENGELVGRLPYIIKKKAGISFLTLPLLTPWLGPWIKPNEGKYNKQLSKQHQVLAKLIEQLPKTHSKTIACAPEFTNLIGFHWDKYDLKVGFTYRLENLTNLDDIWFGLRENIRRECRKAEKSLTIKTDLSIKELTNCIEKTFDRQGMRRKDLSVLLERIDAALSKRTQCKKYFAVDANGRIHAAIYVVFDERCAFYLAGGGDPELRNSGAHSYLMWQAIIDASKTSRVFDFEGSMLQPVERFFRAFNAHQTPRYYAIKQSKILKLLTAVKSIIK